MAVLITTIGGETRLVDWKEAIGRLHADALVKINSNVTGSQERRGTPIDQVFGDLLTGLITTTNLRSLSLNADDMTPTNSALRVVYALKENPQSRLQELSLSEQPHQPIFYATVAAWLNTHPYINILDISCKRERIDDPQQERQEIADYDYAMVKLGRAIEKHPALTSLTMNATPCRTALAGIAKNTSLKHLHINSCHFSKNYGGNKLVNILSKNTTLATLSMEKSDIEVELLSQMRDHFHPMSALQEIALDHGVIKRDVYFTAVTTANFGLWNELSEKMGQSDLRRKCSENGQATASAAAPATTAASQDHASAGSRRLDGARSHTASLARERAHPYQRLESGAKGHGK